MKAAVTRQADVPKIATCPECGAEREYRTVEGKPVPTEPNPHEIKEGVELVSGTLTSFENPLPDGFKRGRRAPSTLTDSGASWTPDEFKGAVVVLSVDGTDTEKFRVDGNTETVMTLVFGARVNGPRPPRVRDEEPVYRPSGYAAMPAYRVLSFSARAAERAKEKLWKKHVFICSCGKRYTVDKS